MEFIDFFATTEIGLFMPLLVGIYLVALVSGYVKGVRMAWLGVLGGFASLVIARNQELGDHGEPLAAALVGVLLLVIYVPRLVRYGSAAFRARHNGATQPSH